MMSEEIPILDYVDPLDVEHNFDAVASEPSQKTNVKNGAGDRKSRRRERNQVTKSAKPDRVYDAELPDPLVETTPGVTDMVQAQANNSDSIDTSPDSVAPSSEATGLSPLLTWVIDTYENVSPAVPPIMKAVKSSPIGMSKTLVIAGGLLLGVGVLLSIGDKKRRGE